MYLLKIDFFQLRKTIARHLASAETVIGAVSEGRGGGTLDLGRDASYSR